MSEYLNEDICEFSNDASASSFGWNFQSNAGIFLFLKYIKQAKSIKIESKLQDIEIDLNDGKKVLAQAKSSQDYSADNKRTDKIKDAIISLAKFADHGDKLIYISNIPNTLNHANNAFNNKVVAYSECPQDIKNEIDKVFESVCKSVEKTKNKLKDPRKKAKAKKVIELVQSFDKTKFYISVIHPFWGDEENRYSEISTAVLSFLTHDLAISTEEAIPIYRRLLEYWQNKYMHNSTQPDNSATKSITKESFVWPVAVFLSEYDTPDIDKCLTFTPDKSLKNEAIRRLKEPKTVFHERFEFSNRVIQDFLSFKKEQPTNEKEIEYRFITNCGNRYIDEFKIDDDEELTEYITKVYLYKIIVNYRNMKKITLGIGGANDNKKINPKRGT